MPVDAVATTAPSSPAAGATWFNPDTATLAVWTGMRWQRAVPDPTPQQPGPISVSVMQLAAALRIAADGAALDADNTAILTRLGGVGEALVDRFAPDAPVAIKAEAVVRVAAYLYDMPDTGSGQRYAAAWRNSGADLLIQPWQARRAAFATDEAIEAAAVSGGGSGGGTGGGGLTAAEVRLIIAAYLAANPPASGGGLDADAVDDRIAALVEDWAEHGNDDPIPSSKLPAGVATDAELSAHAGNPDAHRAAPTLASLGGLDLAAVNAAAAAVVRTYTGQLNASDTLARNRLPLATGSGAGAVSAAHQTWYETRQPDPRFTAALNTKLDGIAAGANLYVPPQLLDEFAGDLIGAGWRIVSGAVATSYSLTQPTLAVAQTLTYMDFYQVGDALQNYWWIFRLPTDTPLDAYQVRVGASDGAYPYARIEASTATALGNAGGFDYHTVQIPDKPAGDAVLLLIYSLLSAARFNLPWGQITGAPEIPPIPDLAAYETWPVSVSALPSTPWRRGLEIWNDSGGQLDYGALREFTYAVQDTLYSVNIGTADTTGRIASIAAFKPDAPAVGVNAVANGVYLIGSSGGSSLTLPQTFRVAGTQYTVTLAFAAAGNNYYRVNNLATSAFIAAVPGHADRVVLLDWTRSDGTPLNPAGKCPEGPAVWDYVDGVGGWRANTPWVATPPPAASPIRSVVDGVTLSRTHANRTLAIAVAGVTIPADKVWTISVLSNNHEYSSVIHTDIIRTLTALTAGDTMSLANSIALGGVFGFGYINRTAANGLLIAADAGTDSAVTGAQEFRLWIEEY